MSLPLITPKKLCPFLALVSPSNCHRSISPPPDINIGINSTPLPSSSRMFLLIHNVLPDNKPSFANPGALVKKAINNIISSDEGKELADITVKIIPGSWPQDPHSSSAYLELAQEIKILDTLSWPDLLMDWINTLHELHPLWEVVWALQKKGKDCQMTMHFWVADTKDKVPTGTTDKICTHLEYKGHRTIGRYNVLVDITFTDTSFSWLYPGLKLLHNPICIQRGNPCLPLPNTSQLKTLLNYT